MLTDYHVHLRPDARPSEASDFFTAANAERYREAAGERGIEELGASEHIHRFTAALEIWQHPFWRASAQDDVDAYCGFVREETDLKLGIEADFIAGREEKVRDFLDARAWDYVVGSVHFVRDFAVDLDDVHDVWRSGMSPDRIWSLYFDTLAEAARTGLYDVMAHPDLVKIWSHASRPDRPLPEGDLRRWYEPVVEAFLEADVAVELSTAGLRKPVGELYPSRAFLELVVDAGLPIALSSDAHLPEQLGFGYDRALEELDAVGVREIAVFSGRERSLVPLG